ncbi:MAG: hypothetical protein FWF69_02790 [Firmicutes bacterium]|nr:hypothetical protein [Bacillota bacterium]
MAKQKRKIVKPVYVTKAERLKAKKKSKPMSRELRIGLIAGAAVLALAVILFAVLARAGSLPVKGGVVQKEANWIVSNLAESGARYYKLGEVEGIAGFERREETLRFDPNESDFWFRPTDPDSQVKQYYITGVKTAPAQTVEKVYPDFVVQYGEERVTQAKTASVAGREAMYFIVDSAYETEEGGVRHEQALIMYIPAIRSASVMLHVTLDVTEEKPALSEDALLALAEEIAGRIVPEGA